MFLYRHIEQLYLTHNTTGGTVSQMCEHLSPCRTCRSSVTPCRSCLPSSPSPLSGFDRSRRRRRKTCAPSCWKAWKRSRGKPRWQRLDAWDFCSSAVIIMKLQHQLRSHAPAFKHSQRADTRALTFTVWASATDSPARVREDQTAIWRYRHLSHSVSFQYWDTANQKSRDNQFVFTRDRKAETKNIEASSKRLYLSHQFIFSSHFKPIFFWLAAPQLGGRGFCTLWHHRELTYKKLCETECLVPTEGLMDYQFSFHTNNC